MPEIHAGMHQDKPQGDNEKKPILCRQCRSPFVPKRPWQRYCSATCQRKSHAGNAAKLIDLERRVADLERRVTVLDDPTAKEVLGR
jgi:hypothetical protein